MVRNASLHIQCRRNLGRYHRQLHANPRRTLSQHYTSQFPISVFAILLLIKVYLWWLSEVMPTLRPRQQYPT